MKERPRCSLCGMVKTASVHNGYGESKHHFEPEPRPQWGSQRQPINHQSKREGRVERRQETRKAMQEYARTHPTCEGPAYGIPIPCGGPVLDVHHVEPRGMGGGEDTKVFKRLCRDMHNWVETHRAEARTLGLLRRKPPVDLPPRPSEQADRPRPVRRLR